MKRCNILILAGTNEARLFANQLAAYPDIIAVASLAGATDNPQPYCVPVRIGGFGGVDGLHRFLRANTIDLLINATHPFAEKISQNAQAAARLAGIPLLRLTRQPWTPTSRDRWIDSYSLADTVEKIPEGERVFFATGSGSILAISAAASRRPKTYFLVRAINFGQHKFPANFDIISALPPFSLQDELRTLSEFGITYLVTKNSGGSASATKLRAACELKIPVVMIARKNTELADSCVVYSVEDGLRWVEDRL